MLRQMFNSCAFWSLAVSLCLVVCVSASTKVDKGDAERAVADTKKTVNNVRERARSQLNKANGLVQRVDSSKSKAQQASSHAEEVKAGNTAAAAIATKVNSLSNEVLDLYSQAKGKLDAAVSTLTGLVEEAQGLDDGSTMKVKAKEGTEDDFTEANQKATALKDKATELDGRITAAEQLFTGVDNTADTMAQKAKEAQLEDSHVSAIVAFANIESSLKNADNIIGQIEEKKNAVNRIVEEMQTLKPNPSVVPDANIEELHKSAADALRDATDAVQNAKDTRTEIQTQKDLANAALTKVQAEKQDVSNANKEVQKAEACVATVQQIVSRVQIALQTATNSVTSANNSKEQLQAAMSKATSAQNTEQIVTNPEVKALQDSVSADVKTIQTMVKEADRIFQETENHKGAVNDIVQEMKALKTTAKIESNEDINKLCRTAEGELTKVTSAAEKVKTEKESIRQQKLLADAALREVNAATEIDMAQKQVATAKSCLDKVKKSLDQVRTALQTANNSVAKANNLKQQLKTALSTTTTASSTNEVKEIEKSGLPVGNGTEPDQQDTTIQPTITNTEQLASKALPSQIDSSADKLNDTLSKGAQNVLTTALTGGKAPTPGANNDSAMTVSVPLLVALIASAVLQ